MSLRPTANDPRAPLAKQKPSSLRFRRDALGLARVSARGERQKEFSDASNLEAA
jgi:hypothetical protein